MNAVQWLTENNMHPGFNEHFKYWTFDEMKNVINDWFQLYSINNVPSHEKQRLVYYLKKLKEEDIKRETMDKISVEPQISTTPPYSPSSPISSSNLQETMTIQGDLLDLSSSCPPVELSEQETTTNSSSSVRRRIEENEPEKISDDDSFGSLGSTSDPDDEVHKIKEDTETAWTQVVNFVKCYDPNITMIEVKDGQIEIYASQKVDDLLIEDIPILTLFKSHKKYGDCIFMTPNKRNQTSPVNRTGRYADLKEDNWGFMECSGRSNRKYYSCLGKTYSNINAIIDFVMPY